MKNSQYTKGQAVTVKVKGVDTPATYEEWSETYEMPIVLVNGKRMFRKIYDTAGARVMNAPAVKQSRFEVNQRFEFIEEVTNMVVEGESNSVIITGSGGLGKTYTVMECLKKAGLDEIYTDDDDEGDGHVRGDYEIVKGFVTPKALYRLLYNNRERLVVFDDCDSVWDNPTTVSLLKAALDSYETRNVSWFSEGKSDEDDLPQRFEFKGKIIFVSNLKLTDLDQAVLSRCLYVDVSMTAHEKVARLRSLKGAIRPDMSAAMKDECIELIEEHAENIGDLNIRTMLKVCEIRHNNKPNWRDLAEYVITAL